MGKVKAARKALKKKHANSGAKTHSGTKDRVKITGSGKLIIGRSGTNHLQLKQSAKGKRAKKHGNTLSGRNLKNIKRLLGV